MVDFKKLREAKAQPAPVDPIEVFRRLPKAPGINDLYSSQAHVLEEWNQRRSERDIVIKLHTGGGKTLVGLLIGQSVENETGEPVIYLCPTVQLVDQTIEMANRYNIPSVSYVKGEPLPDEFLTGASILVCTYQALFNGQGKFGVRGGVREIVHAGAIILDDAHVAFSAVRDSFTIKVNKDKDSDGYAYLTEAFRSDFEKLDRWGTFDDIVGGSDFGILEVPYWNWSARITQVREYLKDHQDDYPFVWPFLRDSLEYCHALITRDAFVVTPILPMVDLVPTFSECPKRIYMSATISDDSSLVRTFAADAALVRKPIKSSSLAGVSERMILMLELMKLENVAQLPQRIAKGMATKEKVGTAVLVPSRVAAKNWQTAGAGAFAESHEGVSEAIRKLRDGEDKGPYVFANRYDGIDLPGDACRCLIMAGAPQGMNEYDSYRANVLAGGSAVNTLQAQRIEQGMGRAARGAGDYCVVVVTGKDLISWLSRTGNLRFLTSATRAQIEMGQEVSKAVGSLAELVRVMRLCLSRDKEWIQYHAQTLADQTESQATDPVLLQSAEVERKALKYMRDGYFDKGIAALNRFCEQNSADQALSGWMKQFAARMAHYWGRKDLSLELQQAAYSVNNNLLRPQVLQPYARLALPGKQAETIVSQLGGYTYPIGFLAKYDEIVSHLVPEASANAFEQALANLGAILGFTSERPEKTNNIGPDVLWLLEDKLGLVIEAKSHKKDDGVFTKDNQGQLLASVQWFKSMYPGWQCIPVSVLPSATASKSVVIAEEKALTLAKLNELIVESRTMLERLCESSLSGAELVALCEQSLQELSLSPGGITNKFLVPFQKV